MADIRKIEVDTNDELHLDLIKQALGYVNESDYPFIYAELEWLDHFIARVTGGKCKDCGADYSG